MSYWAPGPVSSGLQHVGGLLLVDAYGRGARTRRIIPFLMPKMYVFNISVWSALLETTNSPILGRVWHPSKRRARRVFVGTQIGAP